VNSPETTASPRLDWRWLALIWVILATTLTLRAFRIEGPAPFFGDTDDAMRIVVVQDLIAGQGWYDLVQHRLNTPFGAEIHWSRLVDLPLAGLLLALTPILGEPAALVVTGTLWPLLLVGAVLYLSARLCLELVGEEAVLPALVLPVLNPAILAEFTPGRVDHHNIVIVLTLAMLTCAVISLRRPRWAWLAGAAGATALAVAIESLPLVLAVVVAYGLAFVADPVHRRAMRDFGLGLGLFTGLHLALARPPARWLEAACDMLSPVFALGTLVIGAALLLVSLLPLRTPILRLVALALAGGVGAALVVGLYPQCLAGPYGALDPWLQTRWIAAISEAKPWHRSLVDLPPYTVAVGVPALLGLGVGIVILVRSRLQRIDWLVAFTVLVFSSLVMLGQVRGARLAVLPAIPFAAWLIVTARTAFLARPGFWRGTALIGGWLAFSGIILALAVGVVLQLVPADRSKTVLAARASKAPCLAPSAFTELRTWSPARLMVPIDLGSHVLLETPHSVVAAPYHRNEAGILDTFRFFNGSLEDAQAIASARGIDFVVTCPALPEMNGIDLGVEDTLLARLAGGDLPVWLEDVPGSGPLRILKVTP
jgi:hypothetical protein